MSLIRLVDTRWRSGILDNDEEGASGSKSSARSSVIPTVRAYVVEIRARGGDLELSRCCDLPRPYSFPQSIVFNACSATFVPSLGVLMSPQGT